MTESRLADNHLRSSEEIARRLISQSWPDGPNTFWEIQVDLLNLLRRVQSDISREKKRPRRERDHELIHGLRVARIRARQVGDAFAWVLLGMDKQYLSAMGKNSYVPVPDDNHGAAGVESIALGLAEKGYGFPLLHDVTHCLRIGDITFVKPGRNPPLLPVEIKTRHVGEVQDGDGGTRQEYRVDVLSPMVTSNNGDIESTPIDRGLTFSDLPSDRSTRIKRQEARMASAVLDSLAPMGELIPDSNGGRLFIAVDSDSHDHWRTLRRLIRRAHSEGYASETVDEGAIHYSVYYKAGGVDPSDIEQSDLLAHVMNDGLILPPPANNEIQIVQIPSSEDNRLESRYLPFHLWPLPKRAIFELHHGELILFVLTNPAHYVKRLIGAGFRTEPGSQGAITVWADLVDSPRRRTFTAEYPFVSAHINEAVHEFRSADFVVDSIVSIVNTLASNLPGDVDEPPLSGPGATDSQSC